MPPRRPLFIILIALVVAAGCVRLGLWQLDRLGERRAVNARVAARMAEPPVRSLGELPADTAVARYRQIELEGEFDFEHEIVLTARTHAGAPGVHILTPLRLAGEDEAVLVNRGWAYSPDGASVSLAEWRESRRAAVSGYVQPFEPEGTPVRATADRSFRFLDHGTAAAKVPYPVAPWIVVMMEGVDGERTSGAATDTGGSYALPDAGSAGAPVPGTPARVPRVALGERSHLSYAMQWFFFAAIALIGGAVLAAKERKAGRVAGKEHMVAPELTKYGA